MKAEVSALMDDALEGDAAADVLTALKRDAGLRDAWAVYHLLGDALRRTPMLSPGFALRVIARLSDEPTVLAPVATRRKRSALGRAALPLAASVMGIGAVAWVAQTLNQPQQPMQMAIAPAPLAAPAATTQVAAVVPAALPAQSAVREYLIAHQGYSPSNNMNGVANYVRTVAENRPSEAR